jgi:hypothetical protein
MRECSSVVVTPSSNARAIFIVIKRVVKIIVSSARAGHGVSPGATMKKTLKNRWAADIAPASRSARGGGGRQVKENRMNVRQHPRASAPSGVK